MTDRHKIKPKAVRMPDGLLPRVEAAARENGESVNGFIVAAITEKLDRQEGATTSPASAEGGSTSAPGCPHPKARVHKGLCGACGTHVG